MGKYVTGVLSLGLTVLVLGGGRDVAAAIGGDEEPPPKITLRVYNYARVPAPILVSTEPVATKIFRQAAIETEWLIAASPEPNREPRPVNAHLPPRT